MYKVSRKERRIAVTNSNGEVIYSAEDDSLIVFRQQGGIGVKVEKIGVMTDEGLLVALANVVNLKP